MLNRFNIINILFAMKNTVLLGVIFTCISVVVYSQPDETLITIGKTKISKGEFERIYQKNNNNLYVKYLIKN